MNSITDVRTVNIPHLGVLESFVCRNGRVFHLHGQEITKEHAEQVVELGLRQIESRCAFGADPGAAQDEDNQLRAVLG